MNILVVDDEDLARDRLLRILDRLAGRQGGVEVVGQASNGLEAVRQCQSLLPDIVLLDIRMPGMDGLEAARHIARMETPPAVIFCTAYEEHAIAAFDAQAVGYLLKPVREHDLEDALARASRANRAQLAALLEDGDLQNSQRSHISARTRRGIELVPVDEIRYFQADQKYVTVRWPEGELLIDDPLRQLETEFGDRFVRIHRNALVALRFLESLERDAQGHYRVRMRGIEESLDVSRRHVAGLRRFIQSL
ncbi:MAG: response regulator transcription factor [Gammaproteobacteria bacterium]|nr:response regulator transcription factor [Gammaproteobacteria bacterium]